MNMNTFKQLTDWKKQMGMFFGDDFLKGFDPMSLVQNEKIRVNLYEHENDNELLVVFSIPGLQKVDDIQLYVQYQTLIVKGKINLNFKGFKLAKQEIYQGQFERNVTLSYPVRDDRVEATYHHGLLLVQLHRLVPDETKRKVIVKKLDT